MKYDYVTWKPRIDPLIQCLQAIFKGIFLLIDPWIKEENKFQIFRLNYFEGDSVSDCCYLVSSHQASWLVYTFFVWMVFKWSGWLIKIISLIISLFQHACFPWIYFILRLEILDVESSHLLKNIAGKRCLKINKACSERSSQIFLVIPQNFGFSAILYLDIKFSLIVPRLLFS